MENVRNIIDLRLVSNKKDYLKLTSKPSYMPQKIFDNDLFAICKNKVMLTFNKSAICWNVHIIFEQSINAPIPL